MPAFRFLNDIVKPWDELNALLAQRLALQPELSDVTRLADCLAVAIRHQVDISQIKDSDANAECSQHRIISDMADFWKHGSLRKPARNNRLITESLFEYKKGEGFSFLRNALFIDHASLGTHDFLQTSLVAIHYWIKKRGMAVAWQGSIRESPAEFFDHAFLNFESKKCISLNQVRLGFFSRQPNGSLERISPPEVRFAVYERLGNRDFGQ